MSGLRICMLTTFYPPYNFGGDGIAVQRLARALVQRGHHVTAVHDTDSYRALHPGTIVECPDEDDDAGVRVLRLHSRLGALSALLVQQLGRPVVHAHRLRQLLASGRFDVVNFHNVSLMGAPGLLRYPTDAVTLYTAHEHWLVCPTHVLWRHRREPCDRKQCLRCVLHHHRPPQLWRYTGALKRALARVDAVIAMSEFSRAKHRAFGLEREMVVLPPLLPSAEPDTIPPSTPAGQAPYFFFAGRLEVMKGLDDVLTAFRGYRGAELIIAGEGSQRARWQRTAADLPHVRFLGHVAPAEIVAWQRGALAAIVPTLGYETFGLVAAEAMRVGTPVIARDIGPFPELIRATGAGTLFRTAPELVIALERIGGDSTHRAALAHASRQAAARWDTDSIIDAYLAIIANATAARARPAAHGQVA